MDWETFEAGLRRCSFTGHRRLPEPEAFIRARLEPLLVRCIQLGCQEFLSGMALGFDLLAAQAVLDLKQRFDHIRLTAVLPCPPEEQTLRWSEAQRRRYNATLDQADRTVVVSPRYTGYCMGLRNRYLVDNCTLLIAYQYQTGGGTVFTTEYARRKNCPVLFLPTGEISC